MSENKFPNNPENGEIVQTSEDIFFQYQKSSNSWKRLDGFKNIVPATSNTAGLMTASDFQKVDSIILPSFDTSLTAENCNTVFTEGKVNLISSKDDIRIEHKLKLYEIDKSVDWEIFQNTAGINFTVNLDRFIEELESRGRIKYRKTQGPVGDQGEQGDPGRDDLGTGPQGEQGEDGVNAPFDGILISDNTPVSTGSTNRAVVDIYNDPDNPKEIVVKIANIGNPDACPDSVKWKNRNSNWVVATSNNQAVICPTAPSCKICDTELFYLDMTTILDQIKDRYNAVIADIRDQKQALVNTWLQTLVKVFNNQKQAICCAIEAISTKNKNQDIRNIFSGARAQAAQAGYALNIVSDGDPKIPRSAIFTSPGEFIDEVPISSDVIINGTLTDAGYANFNCSDCYVQVTLDSSNMGHNKALAVKLPAGDYAVTLVKCCINYTNVGSKGVYVVRSTIINEDGELVYKEYKNVDKGPQYEEEAPQVYTGDTISFSHAGGQALFFANPEFACKGSSGELVLCVQPIRCIGNCPYPGTGQTGGDEDLTCEMAATHLEFYERGWRIDECCGAHVSIMGNEYIIVYRSFRTDLSCGGGEYETTPCIAQFLNSLGHVAIAWPTVDGINFFGIPDGADAVAKFMYDETISQQLVEQISLGNTFTKKGDPSVITHVIVPMV